MENLFFRGKNELRVDLGDLQAEQEKLSNFLRAHYKIDSSPCRKGLKLNASTASAKELEHVVNKFIAHYNLSSTHWTTLDKNTIKIKRFNRTKKPKENKHPTQPSIITHGW